MQLNIKKSPLSGIGVYEKNASLCDTIQLNHQNPFHEIVIRINQKFF
jgi:hypothetical protein